MRENDEYHSEHKASILRQMFNGGKVSKDRLRIVRGLSHSPTPAIDSSVDESRTFIVGDPFVTVFGNVTKDGHRTILPRDFDRSFSGRKSVNCHWFSSVVGYR